MAQTKEGAKIIAAKKTGVSLQEYETLSQTLKHCYRCREWKSKKEFNTDNSRWDKLSSKCHDCIRVKIKKCTKGRPGYFKGKTHTQESKDKNRNSHIKLLLEGKTRPPMLNKKHTIEAREKISKILRVVGAKGNRCHSYKDGKLKERMGIRFSVE